MIAHIVATSENNCIGINGSLPWDIPEDMKHFKEVTMGKTVIMGRKTWESIPEKFRPLPGRENIILTRQSDYTAEGGIVVQSIEEALKHSTYTDQIIIGGGEIYLLSLPYIDTIYLTKVHREVEGDAYYPHNDLSAWTAVEKEDHDDYSFITYKKM